MKLLHPPIVEAVLDIDCDFPPGFNLVNLEEKAGLAFRSAYPSAKKRFLEQLHFERKGDNPADYRSSRAIHSLLFAQKDEQQLVQIRDQGFSFNRLTPYTSLDDYLPEIERTWKIFLQVASPLRILAIRLNFINRILLPTNEKHEVELGEYIKIPATLQDDKLVLTGFLNQYSAVERETGNKVDLILTGQPFEEKNAPVILHITASRVAETVIDDWASILHHILLLRGLKNRVFENTLTQKCLNLFQPQ